MQGSPARLGYVFINFGAETYKKIGNLTKAHSNLYHVYQCILWHTHIKASTEAVTISQTYSVNSLNYFEKNY